MTTKHRFNRRRFLAAASSAASLLPAALPVGISGAEKSDKWADLTGRFVYDGTAPERKKLTVDKDVECCGKFDIRDESLMVDKDGGLGNVFIYVRSRRVDVCPELEQSVKDKVVLDNRDCIFKPHCMTIWYTKQTFEIVNSDPVGQNVAFSPIFDTPQNIVLPVKGKATHTFGRNQTIPVKIVCNYHPWESAYILPRDNPYAAVSKPDGTFRLTNLPVGELEFQVWQERSGYVATPDWARGRFKMEIKSGVNDLGTVKLDPELFAEPG
ncbi:MAG: hypothetical protein ISR77_36470 [Pirellulaceae bacterium]|nr:hypothetical protein [Pirellulaceae bacterium]